MGDKVLCGVAMAKAIALGWDQRPLSARALSVTRDVTLSKSQLLSEGQCIHVAY